MRIRRLDLVRYGRFTDGCIHFGPRQPGMPDLHVIYGPNEAGKSTALSAYLDLLFGIEERTAFAFLHPYSTMRIGGEFEFASGTRQLSRIKGKANTLRDARDEPVPETLLQVELAGFDRAAYRRMYSLDDETIEKGGQDILNSRGDLAALLFSASAGLADLHKWLEDLDKKADGIYRPRAHGGQLAELKARLEACRGQRLEIDTSAARFAELRQKVAAAEATYEAARAARADVAGRRDEVARLLSALPHFVRWRERQAEAEALAHWPEPPAHFSQNLPALLRAEAELTIRHRELSTDLARTAHDLAACPPDDVALALAPRLAGLAESESRFRSGTNDLPNRRLDLGEIDGAIASLLHRLDVPPGTDPASLLLPARLTAKLRAMIEEWSGIAEAVAIAAAERARAENAEAAARAALVALGAGPAVDDSALAALQAALDRHGRIDHIGNCRKAEAQVVEAERRFALRLFELGLAPDDGIDDPGTPDAAGAAASEALAPAPGVLDRIPPPAATRAQWAKTFAALEAAQAGDASAIGTARAEIAGLAAEIETLARRSSLVDDAHAAALRHAREAAWDHHRARLDAPSADAFEVALRADDAAGEKRLAAASDLAALRHKQAGLAREEARLADLLARQVERDGERVKLEADVAAALAALGACVERPVGPAALAEWLERREKAREAREEVIRARAQAQEAQQGEEDALAALEQALRAFGRTGPLPEAIEDRLAHATRVIADAARQKERARALAEAEAALTARHAGEQAAARRAAEWRMAYAEACAACWIGQAGPLPELPEMRAILEALTELAARVERRKDLAERIRKMEADTQAFAREIAGLAAAAASREDGAQESRPLAVGEPLVVLEALKARIAAAQDNRTRREETLRRKARSDDALEELARSRAVHAQTVGEMTAFFGVESIGETESALEAVARRAQARTDAEAAHRHMVLALGARVVGPLLERLEQADRVALEQQRAELDLEIGESEAEMRSKHTDLFTARAALDAVGGDDAAARLDQTRETLLAEIDEGAARYLRLRIGVAAARRALQIYRERHKSSMLARAAEAFSTITGGRYAGLSTQPDDRGAETIIAQPAGGGAKAVTHLSKGTRFQLYLALRVAGHAELAALRPPVPFIADDILETFDDERALSTFRVLGQMAQVGQVIYLTHHRHLCEIARAAVPALREHHLG